MTSGRATSIARASRVVVSWFVWLGIVAPPCWSAPSPHLRLCELGRPAAPCTFEESHARLENLSPTLWYRVRFEGYVFSFRACAHVYCADWINPGLDVEGIKPRSHPEYEDLIDGCQLPHTVPCPPEPEPPYEVGSCPKTMYCCSNKCDNYDVGCENPYCAQVDANVQVLAWSQDGANWTAYDPPALVIPDPGCKEHDATCRD